MALCHTILTLLCESAYSGYDLSKRFDDVVSCFWNAHHQQIYRELANMERLGWIQSEAISQRGKPDKKIYRITQMGRKELEKWFVSPCSPSPIREDLLVKVIAGASMPHSALIQQIREQRSLHERKLNSYREQEQSLDQLNCSPEHLKFHHFALQRGIRHEVEWLDWCDEILAAL